MSDLPQKPPLAIIGEIRARKAVKPVDDTIGPQGSRTRGLRRSLQRAGLPGLARKRPGHPEPLVAGLPDRSEIAAAIGHHPFLSVGGDRVRSFAPQRPHAGKVGPEGAAVKP